MAKRTGFRNRELGYLQENREAEVQEAHELYQSYTVQEDIERTNVHYEYHPDFFYSFTGGEWNCYSCNIWDEDVTNDTQSQERKLDLMAHYMGLQPGMRILDVGCGWGGPLTYLCKTYQCTGVGLTLSHTQKKAADERAKRYGVDIEIRVQHWEEFDQPESFDAIYTDEVIVHFNDLLGFFKKCYRLLKPGGMMVHKEGHFTRKEYLTSLSRGEVFVNEIYGFTGNYRTVWEELQMVDEAGMQLVWHHQIDRAHYRKTFDAWLSNMYANRQRMIEVASEDDYKRFRIYVKLVRQGFNSTVPTVDIIASRKPVDDVPKGKVEEN
jgi:cyclopropane-fatty-acyl-phospholipid synthase